MEQFDYNIDDDIFNDLLPDGDYSSVRNDIPFSNYFPLEDDNPNQLSLPLLFDDTNAESSSSIDANSSSELNRILTDSLYDNVAILDEEQFFEQPIVHQNPDVIDIPTPQQATGNEDGIMFLMCISLFNCINGFMSVKQQPKANNHVRYQCDGSRFLPDSRYHPMAINLPDLRSYSLENNATFGIVMTIVTDEINGQTFVHANDIFYRVDNAKKIGYGCVFVPLEKLDIENREKKFPRCSIVYKKCDEYTFNITPFNKSSMFGTTGQYTSKDKKNVGNAAKGKDFKKDYNLSSYKIIFQLAIKQDNVVYISNIACETETIDEQTQTTTTTTKKSGKRSASVSTEIYSEEESSCDIQMPSSSKKFKSSTPPPSPLIGLPVTRVSSFNIELDMDHEADPC